MKLAKNVSILRILFAVVSLLLLMVPWYQLGMEFPSFMAGGKIIVDSKYLVVGFLFILSMLLQIFEQRFNLKIKKEQKPLLALEKASDQILLYGLLIVLAFNGFISVVVPVLIIGKFFVVENMKKMSVDNGKMAEKSRLGIYEKTILNLGIIFLLFYNLPFELWNLYIADGFIMIATVLCVLNGSIYCFQAKNLLMKEK